MIEINNKYAIKSDERQWILCKKAKVTQSCPDGWKPFKFYPSLSMLCESLSERLLRESDYQSFSDLSRNMREIVALMNKKIKPLRMQCR